MMDLRINNLLKAEDYTDVIDVMNSIDKELFESLIVAQNNDFHKYNVRDHIVYTVLNTEHDLELRLAALLHDIGKRKVMTTTENGKNHFYGHEDASAEMAISILNDLGVSGIMKDNIINLVKYHDHYNRELPKISKIREIASLLGADTARKWIKLKYADMMAQSDHSIEVKSSRLKAISDMVERTISDGTAIRKEDLDINFEDIAGVDGAVDVLLHSCWGNPKSNNRKTLLKIVRSYNKCK